MTANVNLAGEPIYDERAVSVPNTMAEAADFLRCAGYKGIVRSIFGKPNAWLCISVRDGDRYFQVNINDPDW